MPQKQISFNSREELLQHLKEEMGVSDSEKRKQIANVIMDEAKSENGNPKQLLERIKNGAKSLMTDIGLETVSWVETPSQDSMFVMMKDNENRVRKTTSIYKQPDEDWEVVYGPVMRPNDIDKDGDVAPTNDIRKAAHEFISEGRVKQFDTNHDLNTGKGTLVESWILKEDTEYELPNGDTETIEKGSWMVGVKPDPEIKSKIENGEITGWSIFGQADQIQLSETPSFKARKNKKTFKEDTMSENQTDKKDETQDQVSIKDVHSELQTLKSEFNEFADRPEPSTVKTVDELQKTIENLEQDSALVEVGKDFEPVQKEPEMDNLSDLMDYLEDNLMEENFSMIVDAVRGSEDEEMVEEEMDEDEEEEDKAYDSEEDDEEKTEKEEEQTAKHKAAGKSGIGTDNTSKSAGSLDFQSRADKAASEV